MNESGVAMMGSGVGTGDTGALDAATAAISSPLLEDLSIDGARGVLINVTGGESMTLFEVNEASVLIQEAAHEDANIIFGAVIDDEMPEGQMRVTMIATCLNYNHGVQAPVRDRGLDEDRHVQVGSVRASHRETVPVHAAEPIPDSAPPPRAAEGEDGAIGARELSHAGVEFASPFDDEFDTPAFLRRRATEN
jgi:cell division protein FtsZ